jgi:O-antigen/teichoic acid export membrane protein
VVGGVFALRTLMSLVLFVVMAGVLWVTGRSGEILVTALVFGLINLLTAINATLGIVLNTTARVGHAAASNIAAKVVWGAGILVGLHYNAPLAVLALPGLAGEILRVAVMIPANRREAGLEYRIDVVAVRGAVLESVPFFVNSLALGVLGSLGMSVLEFVRVDDREVGWFAAAQNVAYLCTLLTPLMGWVIMPLLSRAYARSEDEGMVVFRRSVEGLIITIVPITVLMSAGSDVLIHFAFGDKYAPARTGLSILSLVFVMTYLDTMLAMVLIIRRQGWSVTIISISAVFITAILMFMFVPLGRHVIGVGGECAGAAASVIGSEACVLVAMLSRFRTFPLDARDIRVIVKSVALGLFILVVDRQLRFLGAARLLVDGGLYVVLAFAIRVVRVQDIRQLIKLLRLRRAEGATVDAGNRG